MKTLFYRIFVAYWPRKLISLLLAIIIWLLVNQTLTSARNLSAVPIHIINIPEGKTVEGMQPNGRLTKKMNLTLIGNKTFLETVTPQDVEILLDASRMADESLITPQKGDLVSLNPELDLSNGLARIHCNPFVVRMSRLLTEQISVVITQPTGEAPRGYQFLDVWPYRLSLSVSGPEEAIRRLKMKEQRITFDLTEITKSQLDTLAQVSGTAHSGIVSYRIPDQWKCIHIPLLSETPIPLDDPQAEGLRIDFLRCHLLPIHQPIPVTLFFPEKTSDSLNPQTLSLASGGPLVNVRGIDLLTMPLYANGVDRLFLETVKNRMRISVVVTPSSERAFLEWSVEFINPRQLEEEYLSTFIANSPDHESNLLQPSLREEYLRNRFRSYMNRFQLFKGDDTPLNLSIRLNENHVELVEVSS